MIKIINLVGARPQFVKAAMISRVLRENYADTVQEIVVHSGQHYDANLSEVFFDQLGIPEPKYHLGAGQGSGEDQVDFIQTAFGALLKKEQPDVVLVYGDTNTTRAGAEAAADLRIPIAHVEAGLRSYNEDMPEEHNRVVTDQLSSFLFVPTTAAVENLKQEQIVHVEGRLPIIAEVGDIMIDSLRVFGEQAKLAEEIAEKRNGKPIALVTIHRNYNADDPTKLNQLLAALEKQTDRYQVIFPLHPRTAKSVDSSQSSITFLPPISYFDMLALEKQAALILTDSGGVQKEAYHFSKPLVILRSETEWTELLDKKLAVLSGLGASDIASAIEKMMTKPYPQKPGIYGNGHAAEKICETLIRALA